MPNQSSTPRKCLRFNPEKTVIVELELNDETGDYCLSGIMVNESIQGCAIATIAHEALKPNLICTVKFPNCNPSQMKIVHIQQLIPNLVVVGCEYSLD